MSENNESEVREHLNKLPKCRDCKFWEPKSKAGECHRHTPQIIWGRGEHEDAIQTVFPETYQSEWCGEFEHAQQ